MGKRFHFSLGGLLILVAMLCAVFAWTADLARSVHERQELLALIWSRGGIAAEPSGAQPLHKPYRWAWVRAGLGDRPFANISFHSAHVTRDELQRIELAFPEAKCFPSASLALKGIEP